MRIAASSLWTTGWTSIPPTLPQTNFPCWTECTKIYVKQSSLCTLFALLNSDLTCTAYIMSHSRGLSSNRCSNEKINLFLQEQKRARESKTVFAKQMFESNFKWSTWVLPHSQNWLQMINDDCMNAADSWNVCWLHSETIEIFSPLQKIYFFLSSTASAPFGCSHKFFPCATETAYDSFGDFVI